MRTAFETLCVAFSMYSALPAPHVKWSGRNMRYALCLLPLVGVPIGALLAGLWAAGERLPMGETLRAALATALPLFVTGGLHLDGWCDTADARASHADREQKLAILKDPHIGAFGVMHCILYLLLSFALWHRLSWGRGEVLALAAGFVLSRAVGALFVLALPAARGGLAATFAGAADRGRAKAALWTVLAACAAALSFLGGVYGLCCLAGAGAAAAYFRARVVPEFGGITGDLAGYFLQLCEITMLAFCAGWEVLTCGW